MSRCPCTGATQCRCPVPDAGLQSALWSTLDDHTLYTSWLITASLPNPQPDATEIATRLLENPSDIRAVIEPIVGTELADEIEDAFAEHLKLAAETLPPVQAGDTTAINSAVATLYRQGDTVANFVSQINPSLLPFEMVSKEFRTHNEYVVELATLRNSRRYTDYIKVFDSYRQHMKRLSDAIYRGLVG